MTVSPLMMFWEMNTDCWQIRRSGLVKAWLYLPTGRYIFLTTGGEWKGTKVLMPIYRMTPEQKAKLRLFESEQEAVDWLRGVRFKKLLKERKYETSK